MEDNDKVAGLDRALRMERDRLRGMGGEHNLRMANSLNTVVQHADFECKLRLHEDIVGGVA